MTFIQAHLLEITIALSSIVASAIVSFVIFWSSQTIERRRATLNFFAEYNNDQRVSDAFRVIKSEKYLLGFSDNDKKERDDFLFLMCKLEALAIGLKSGIYDKKMINDMFGRDLKKIYNESKPLIEYIRTNETDSDAFTAFEQLAKSIKTTVSY